MLPVGMRRALLLASVFWIALLTLAQQPSGPIPHAQDRPPGPALSPEEAIAKMTVPPGFSVELVASEPDIVNPVAMTFDERGRVWITESLEYPRHSPGPGRDRVKVLEDTDGDGKADKFTVFAEGLNIPSGVAVGHGGVWVANAPDILFLRDADGDGKADSSEVVVTGFGRFDTHELAELADLCSGRLSLRLERRLQLRRVDRLSRQAGIRVQLPSFPDRPQDPRLLELFCEGTSNPWGIDLGQGGLRLIALAACVIDHLWHLTETGYYQPLGRAVPAVPVWKLDRLRRPTSHQKAAYCGPLLSSTATPTLEKYASAGSSWGTSTATSLSNVDVPKPRGLDPDFGTAEPDFLSANDAWFMPVVQKVGPDGSLYILDWYDRNHCYQDANRDPNGIDRLKGRLYRVHYKDTPRAPRFDLAKESDDQLIARLGSPNIYYRENAQRLLRERINPAVRGGSSRS